MSSVPATINVPVSELADLRARLRNTRWSAPWPVTGWQAGVPHDELRRLVHYWASDYDWAHHEADINALPSYTANIAGTPLHYLHFAGEGPNPMPVILTNGWPSSFLELLPLARRLSRPIDHDRDPGLSFDVVVPSLPGFGLSPQLPTLGGHQQTHELWHRLMTEELGYDRYAAHGGDLGSGVTARLAESRPESVIGIHVLSVAAPTDVDPATVTLEEQHYLDSVGAWTAEEGGYLHQQSTRPLTLAHGLSDSPAGLLAWILEKHHAWSDRHDGRMLPFDDDYLLTLASLYWFTNSISTSFRPYYEFHHKDTPRVRRVPVPTAVALFPADLSHPPRSWAARTYDVARYTVMPRGGHFPAIEETSLLAKDIVDFFTGRK